MHARTLLSLTLGALLMAPGVVHAGEWVFVGPLDKDHTLIKEAPLTAWMLFRSFDTALGCEEYRDDADMNVLGQIAKFPDGDPTKELLRKFHRGYLNSLCVPAWAYFPLANHVKPRPQVLYY